MRTVIAELVRVDVFDPKVNEIGHVTVCLPGILAYGTQFEPLSDALASYGSVHTLTYLSTDIDATIVAVVGHVVDLIMRGKTVTLFGASLGGDITLFVVERLRARLGDLMVEERITVRLDDCPIGGESMKPLPDLFRRLLIKHPRPPIPDFIGGLFLLMMMGLPQDKNIEMPDDTTTLTGRRIDDIEAFRVWVKAQAKQGLSGHKFSSWWSQLSWMCRVGASLPFDTLRGLPVVYVRCNGKRNDTINQPATGDLWHEKVPHAVMLEVDTPHCAYLEANQKWLDATSVAFSALFVEPIQN